MKNKINEIWEIFKKVVNTILMISYFILCELFILSFGLIAISIMIGGIVCLIGLFVPVIRNIAIIVDFTLSLKIKLLFMTIIGILFLAAGSLGVKKINIYNLKFCKNFLQMLLQKKEKAFIVKGKG